MLEHTFVIKKVHSKEELEDTMTMLLNEMSELKREVRAGQEAQRNLNKKRKQLDEVIKKIGGM